MFSVLSVLKSYKQDVSESKLSTEPELTVALYMLYIHTLNNL
jgi:hypothetical protein